MPMTPITGLDRTSPTFRTELDTFFLSSLPAFVAEANALQADVNAKQGLAAQSVVDAAEQVDLAADQVALAASHASSSGSSASASQTYAAQSGAASNFKGAWVSMTGALAMPASVLHDNKYWALLAPLANVTTETPGASASWALITAGTPAAKIFFLTH